MANLPSETEVLASNKSLGSLVPNEAMLAFASVNERLPATTSEITAWYQRAVQWSTGLPGGLNTMLVFAAQYGRWPSVTEARAYWQALPLSGNRRVLPSAASVYRGGAGTLGPLAAPPASGGVAPPASGGVAPPNAQGTPVVLSDLLARARAWVEDNPMQAGVIAVVGVLLFTNLGSTRRR